MQRGLAVAYADDAQALEHSLKTVEFQMPSIERLATQCCHLSVAVTAWRDGLPHRERQHSVHCSRLAVCHCHMSPSFVSELRMHQTSLLARTRDRHRQPEALTCSVQR